MKNIATAGAFAILLVGLLSPVNAQFASSQTESKKRGPSVADIMDKPPVRKKVVLRGFLMQKLVKNKYLFSDGTGYIGMQFKARHEPAQLLADDRWLEIRGRVINSRASGMPEVVVQEVVVPN